MNKQEIERKRKIALLIIIVLMEKMRRKRYDNPFSVIADGIEVCSWVVRAAKLRGAETVESNKSLSFAEKGEEMIKAQGGKIFLIANNPKMIKMPQP